MDIYISVIYLYMLMCVHIYAVRMSDADKLTRIAIVVPIYILYQYINICIHHIYTHIRTYTFNVRIYIYI